MSFAGFLDIARKDVDIPSNAPKELLTGLHADFITNYEKKKDSYADTLDRDAILDYIRQCQRADGGFAPAAHHDSHLLHTLSAVQILIMYDALDKFDLDPIAEYVRRLQNEDGSFGGDISSWLFYDRLRWALM
ncbi:unnamed protein product [Heligmosomoides polygyrus]|uniref:Geranylgeranyl transferase type II subunit beta n=1 Tax=Heligmosomoides polygyrus TaxID=6339 RepID=A0A183F8Z8_HELPZ|nr:unnamed protein product [Heligmosomoides polygyrus]